MTDRTLRVGLIGASTGSGWARLSHIPALQALDGLVLQAVAGRSQASAEAAAHEFKAARAYGDIAALLRDPTIDLVSVSVKVPDHRAIVLDALAAGKPVFCEWPLGRTLAETSELVRAAEASALVTAIGLQARLSPAVQAAAVLLAARALGRIRRTRVVSTTMAFGPEIEAAMAYAEDPANGVSLPTIQGAHTIDLVRVLLGDIEEGRAMASIRSGQIRVAPQTGSRARLTADHLQLHGRVADAPLSVEVEGGRSPDDTPFRLEIEGERRTLLLEGDAARGFQAGRLRLSLDATAQSVEEGELSGLPDEAVNVGAIYARLRDRFAGRPVSPAPDFAAASGLARLMSSLLPRIMAGVALNP